MDAQSLLEDLIEDERARLMKAESILLCASIAFEYCDHGDSRSPYFPDVATVVGDMLRITLDNLDILKVRELWRVDECAGSKPFEVEDPAQPGSSLRTTERQAHVSKSRNG